MWRLQVKTTDHPWEKVGTYQLSRRQLRDIKKNELFFMFIVRWQKHWRFILIGRGQFAEIRDTFEASDRVGKRGRRPATDTDARTDALALKIEWSDRDAKGWGVSFAPYLDRWPHTFPENSSGPGAIKSADQ
jgi:hypothetical protein